MRCGLLYNSKFLREKNEKKYISFETSTLYGECLVINGFENGEAPDQRAPTGSL